MRVFWICSRSRAGGFGVGTIPLETFLTYQKLFNDELDETDVQILMALDSCYVRCQYSSKKGKADAK